MSVGSSLREPPWRAGLRGARANLGPGLVLQATALTIVLAYYRHEPTRAVLEQLRGWRTQAGFVFSILSTAIFGGVLPFLYLRLNPATRPAHGWHEGAALTLFWGYKGLEIDILYRVLAHFVGSGHDPATIATKAFLDQLVYCPLFAVPLTVLFYRWCSSGFDLGGLRDDFLEDRWYARTVLPTMITNIGVWLPAVAIIYALPTPLQLPLQNLVLCFFTLLLAHLNRPRR